MDAFRLDQSSGALFADILLNALKSDDQTGVCARLLVARGTVGVRVDRRVCAKEIHAARAR